MFNLSLPIPHFDATHISQGFSIAYRHLTFFSFPFLSQIIFLQTIHPDIDSFGFFPGESASLRLANVMNFLNLV
jgi:hypothetical protein